MSLLSWTEVAERALATLSKQERESGAVYLDENEIPAGAELALDTHKVISTGPSALVFVDPTPAVNWGHACRYLLVDRQSREVQSIPAQFPPFLRVASPTLRLIWKGENAPDWALAVRP
jgi:hypothetical protein